ncbi:MAG TPA: glycosyltransferase [Polyangia bacterium]|jgi:GT2 family glycosyltransferase
MAETIGAVAIGRNEGERLRRCLTSLQGKAACVVYVDSGSTDDSVATARTLGAVVVALDRDVPFTAARARNAGLARLAQIAPDVALVQFVDGDCEVATAWLSCGAAALGADPSLAVVCGRRRERHPEASIYNRLCDMEWNTPVGPTDACGGDALMRVGPVRACGGYDETLIAGEEPDLCLRLRQGGWRVLRLDAEMTMHDAAMTRFGQWWRRTLRAGYAFAEGAARHGGERERHWVRQTRSNWLWGLLVPSALIALAPTTGGFSLAGFSLYLVLAARIYRGRRRYSDGAADARLYTVFCLAGKLPQALGQALYWWRRLVGGPRRLIEYKVAETPRART